MVGGKPHVAALVEGDALYLLRRKSVLTAKGVEHINSLAIIVAARQSAAVCAYPHLSVVGASQAHHILTLQVVFLVLIVAHNLYLHLVVEIRHHQNTVG